MTKPTNSKSSSKTQIHLLEVLTLLKKYYPDAHCALHHRNAFELLVATILSAQCTDERVNMVTPALFEKYPDAKAMSKAPIGSLEKLVKSTGFYKNKAKNLKSMSQTLVEQYSGEVPADLESLVGLAGVGRKTANVVLAMFLILRAALWSTLTSLDLAEGWGGLRVRMR